MKNRWIILFAAILLQTILGGIYAWSVFVSPLTQMYGLSSAQAGIIFGTSLATFTLTMVFSGYLLEARGPRMTASIGALLFSAGYLIASFSEGSFPILLFGIGITSGCGIGFGYVCPLSVGIKWFPHNKGLVSGLIVAGFGAGAVFLSKAAFTMMAGGMDVLSVFRWIAIVPGALALLATSFLSYPQQKELCNIEGRKNKAINGVAEAVFSPTFLLLFIAMFAGTFGGLLVIGNLAPIGIAGGIPEDFATTCISVFALSNAVGRISFGQIHDRSGFIAIPISLFVLACGIILLFIPSSTDIFLTAIILTGVGFGACFVVYAASAVQYFGAEMFNRIYPLIFLGYGISGLIAPGIGGFVADRFGSYSIAAGIAVVLATTVGISTLFCRNIVMSTTSQKSC